MSLISNHLLPGGFAYIVKHCAVEVKKSNMTREQITIRLPTEAAGVWTGKTVKALHYLFERCVMRVKAVFGVTQIIPNELHVGLDVGDVFLHL